MRNFHRNYYPAIGLFLNTQELDRNFVDLVVHKLASPLPLLPKAIQIIYRGYIIINSEIYRSDTPFILMLILCLTQKSFNIYNTTIYE